MSATTEHLRARARVLHRDAKQRDATALGRLRRLAELAPLDDATLAASTRRRHCLGAIARELGFTSWGQLVAILRGDPTDDFGTLLSPPGSAAHWNIWCADYDEARDIRAENGGWLLAWRKHFFVADRHYVEHLGLDPEDPDWERIGRDWARPHDADARARLYGKLFARVSA